MYPLKGPYTKVRAKANIAAIWAIGATVAVPNLLVSIFFLPRAYKNTFSEITCPIHWTLYITSLGADLQFSLPPKKVFLARGRDRGRKKFYWQLSHQGKGKLNIPSCFPAGLPRGTPSPAALRRRGNGECLYYYYLSSSFRRILTRQF